MDSEPSLAISCLAAMKHLTQLSEEHAYYEISTHSWRSMAFLCLLLISTFSIFNRKHHISRLPSESLVALLAFITPIAEPQPSRYADIMSHSTCRHSKIIRIQASLLLANIGAGKIELRDASDIARIFCRQLRIYGWSIHLVASFSLRISILRWISLSRLPTLSVRNF